MPKYRDFDTEYAYEEREPLTFTLGGYEFTSKPVIHPAVLIRKPETESNIEYDIRIIRGVLIEDDVKVFDGMLADEEVIISAFQIDDIAAWIVSECSKRPTKRPGWSGNGGKKTGRGSRANSSVTVDQE